MDKVTGCVKLMNCQYKCNRFSEKFFNDIGRRAEAQTLSRAIINEVNDMSEFLIRNICKGRAFWEKLTE